MILFAVMILIGLGGCGENTKQFKVPENAITLDATIAQAFEDAKAIITVVSDDGYFTSGINLNVIFKKHGLKCTIAGNVTRIEPRLSDWKNIIGEGTLEMVSHSYSHAKMDEESEISGDEKALKHEILDADIWLEKHFGTEQIVFVCPENQMCEKGYEILGKNGFWAVRRGTRGLNSLSPQEGTAPGQWFNLMVQGICDDGVDLEDRNGWVDEALAEHAWLIEMWHNAQWTDDGLYQTILIPDAEKHLEYVAEKLEEKEIWNATFTEAVKYLRERQNAIPYAYLLGDELHMYVELTNEKMSYRVFNQPLTIKVTLPEEFAEDLIVTEVIPGEEFVMVLDKE